MFGLMPVFAQPVEIDDAGTMDRFMRRFTVVKSGCWEWIARVKFRPYMRVHRRMVLAARVSYSLFKGPIPAGERLVCHSCDNPKCVNPDHLWLGSNVDNMADKTAKGRQASQAGTSNPRAKLTAEQAREIGRRRAMGESRGVLAAEFGVTHGTVWFIDHGQHWAVRSGD